MINYYNRMAREVELHLESHGAPIKITACEVVNCGERLIFDVAPKKGTRVAIIFKRAKDINATLQLPLFQPFYEGLAVRIVVSPHPVKDYCLLKMLKSSEFRNNKMRLCVPLGYDMRRNMRFYDLASDSAPHTLESGGSGSGKSEFLKCLVTSLVLSQPVRKLNLIVIDCGGNSLDAFHSLPHLSFPLVKNTETALLVLKSLVELMESRLKLSPEELRDHPAIVVVWDEYNSTIKNISDSSERKELTDVLEDLLRRCRKTKMHIVLASQESNKMDMMINLNNLNARIAFRCSDYYNSRAVIGMSGAENLPGRGAMLFKSADQTNPLYVQGAYISPANIERVINYVNSASHDISNKFTISGIESSSVSMPLDTSVLADTKIKTNPKQKELPQIIMWVLRFNTISASKIKEAFPMGNRVDEIMDALSTMGIISEKFSNQPRIVLIKTIDDITEVVLDLLVRNGFSEEDITAAIESRDVQ
jgi:S-DNA-T family DNA segregation ATPase FtsK/SpoIIIE